MSQKLASVVAIIGAVVATAAVSAMAFNSAHPVPQAGGVTVAGWDISQIGNGLLALLGGSAGVWGLIQSLVAKVAPDLGNAINNPIAKQFIQQIPLLLQILGAGKAAQGRIQFVEDVNGVPVTLTIQVGKPEPVMLQTSTVSGAVQIPA